MTREEAIKFMKAMKRGLKSTGKDYPYRDEYIPKMKEACEMAIKALKSVTPQPKQTEKKCSDCKHYVTDGHTTFCSLSKVGGCCVNKDNWTPKKMTLDEAIKHCEEVADSMDGQHHV